MPALMIDSDDLDVLLSPHCAGMRIATYADLVTPEFLHATAGRLTVIDRGLGDPHAVATVADIEPGALSIPSAVARIRQWDHEGRHQPTVYHNRADWSEVNTALSGVPCAHWVATLDGTLVPSGYYMAVVQFAGEGVVGFHADMSIVWADEWHTPPASAHTLPVAGLRQLASVAVQAVDALSGAIGNLA